MMLLATVALAQTQGDLQAWVKLRAGLLQDESAWERIRELPLPVTEGTVVGMEPATRPRTLLVGIETPQIAELRLEIRRDGQPARMHTTPPWKSKIRFRAAAPASFAKRPFLLTATIDEMDLDFVESEGAR